jgi:hypothetical protein
MAPREEGVLENEKCQAKAEILRREWRKPANGGPWLTISESPSCNPTTFPLSLRLAGLGNDECTWDSAVQRGQDSPVRTS